MGNQETKLSFRKAVVELTTKTQPIDPGDDAFWDQFWNQPITSVQDVFALIPSAEIRALREELPSNLATLCYKAVEKLVQVAENSCRTQREQQVALNCVRLLTRLLPYVFEEPEWRGFFWSTMPGSSGAAQAQADADRAAEDGRTENPPLAKTLLATVSDLLFCPDFTVAPLPASRRGGVGAQPDSADDLQSLDSCEYIWEAGVGFVYSPPRNPLHDANRTELLRLLLTCFSETIYSPPPDVSSAAQSNQNRLSVRAAVHNPWIAYFTSAENRHVLPLFVSLLNVVFSYDPVGYGVPYNYLMFDDSSREKLVEACLQVLCVTLENDLELICGGAESASSPTGSTSAPQSPGARGSSARSSVSNGSGSTLQAGNGSENQFVNYVARLHREEDMEFVLRGFIRLLNNPLMQTYLPGSAKRVRWEQELLILFWKMCDANRKFMHFVLKTTDVLSLLQPVLYFVLEARNEPARVGLVHLGVFVLLLVSGERNFGVRLNKPYTHRVSMPDLPVFNGNHADLLVIALHKLITSTQQRLQPLFDCLLTILVNISPYLKSLSMLSATKLLHLFEAFSTGWFLLASPNNHHLVFFLLEIFNNLIQYQFDGNANLVYMIIRKRQTFHQLANLPTDSAGIARLLQKIRASSSSSASTASAGRSSAPFPSLAADSTRRAAPGQAKSDEDGDDGEDHPRPSASNSNATVTSESLSATTTSLAATPSLSSMTAQRVATASGATQKRVPQQLDDDVERLDLEADEDADSPTGNETDADGNDTVRPKSSSNADGDKDDRSVQDRLSSAFRGNAARPQSTRLQSTSSVSQSESSSTPAGPKRSTSMQSVGWQPTPTWVSSWKSKLPLQTIMRLLQVLVPQVEKMCIERGLTDETEILKFLQHGTLVGLLPVPHPILIRKYQPNAGTAVWFRTYMWGVIYLRNVDPPIWFDTDVKLFDIQRV